MEIGKKLQAAMVAQKKTLALAESCTGGAVAARLTALDGASQFFLGSLVVYSNAWKERLLGVSSETLKTKGAVSRETVREMAAGLLERTEADCVAAISGIAGPSGGTPESPVGTVYIAIATRGGKIDVERIEIPNKSRALVIEGAVETVLTLLWQKICNMN